MSSQRSFAIIPAAGFSVRMGRPKLLLPWRGATIIDHVLRAWTESCVTHVIVVIRRGDTALRTACQRWPVEIVSPEIDPSDMKQSIQVGLRHVESVHSPEASDRWLVAPADLPDLKVYVIDALVATKLAESSIAVTRFGDRKGHPVSFPWTLVPEVYKLSATEGINSIQARHPKVFVDFPTEAAIDDIDTPDDYRRVIGN